MYNCVSECDMFSEVSSYDLYNYVSKCDMYNNVSTYIYRYLYICTIVNLNMTCTIKYLIFFLNLNI